MVRWIFKRPQQLKEICCLVLGKSIEMSDLVQDSYLVVGFFQNARGLVFMQERLGCCVDCHLRTVLSLRLQIDGLWCVGS